ncbi:MAG: nucleotidyl transferase AbiEii/AbiGii toxin family protein [Candidatus Hodarchaeales archaeon]|jgi:predicted nucleotidyltransferase component of viral defense system
MAFGIMKTIFGNKKEIVEQSEIKRKMSIKDLQHFTELKGTKDLVRIESEYFQDLILYFLSSYPGIIFKGGTAMRKSWNAKRFSADLDFVGDLPPDVLDELIMKLDQCGYPARIGEVREYEGDDITVKLVIKGIVYLYHHLTIDIFPTSPVTLTPQLKQLDSFFPDIPSFSFLVMSPNEILAEKVRALFSRDRSQDLYDINFLLDVASINMQLVHEKLDYSRLSFSLDDLKREISNLKEIWETELAVMLPETEVMSFDEVEKRVLKAFQDENMTNEVKINVAEIVVTESDIRSVAC